MFGGLWHCAQCGETLTVAYIEITIRFGRSIILCRSPVGGVFPQRFVE